MEHARQTIGAGPRARVARTAHHAGRLTPAVRVDPAGPAAAPRAVITLILPVAAYEVRVEALV
ncbi:hypothetical protein [Acuticoccus yangtzensis]|uniref:hypothetical protein n=1 Tax=Acuticoccus yangtzensis TaxID=1443441 RepID=UPI000AE51543|nr:hypothetical protein [Acuticoccus yangtzensis]